MAFIRVPTLPFLSKFGRNSRHSFNTGLRSLHLSPTFVNDLERSRAERQVQQPPLPIFRTNPIDENSTRIPKVQARTAPTLRTVNGSVPIPKVFFLGLAILLSVVFVGTIMATFRGAQAGPPFFKSVLDEIAETDPGVSLMKEAISPAINLRLARWFCWVRMST